MTWWRRLRSTPQQSISRITAGGDISIEQYFGREERLPLLEPFAAEGDRDDRLSRSLLTSLRATERLISLVGYEDELETARQWLTTPASADSHDHRVMVICGPGGSGKTRLAAEIIAIARKAGWTGGFLSGHRTHETDWARMAFPTVPLIVALDYAEARHADLQRLLPNPLASEAGTASLRVLLIVREPKSDAEAWWQKLSGPGTPSTRAMDLLSDEALTVTPLDAGLRRRVDRVELWTKTYKAFVPRRQRVAGAPAYLDLPLFDRPLFLMLDAVEATRSDDRRGPGEVPDADQLLDQILRHEATYWLEARKDRDLDLDMRQINTVAAIATLVSGVTVDGFRQAIRSLEWLKRDPVLLERTVSWWSLVYGTGQLTIRGLEPDIVGEFQLIRCIQPPRGATDEVGGVLPLEQIERLLTSATPSGRQRMLRVLTRIAETDGADAQRLARSTLARVLENHLEMLLASAIETPRDGIDNYLGVGESMAMTIASAMLASGSVELITRSTSAAEIPRADGNVEQPSPELDAAIVIVRRHVERVAALRWAAGELDISDYAQVVLWAVQLELAGGNFDYALAHLKRLRAMPGAPPSAVAQLAVRLGRTLRDQGRRPDALDIFSIAREALAEDEHNVLRYVVEHDIAYVHVLQGDAAAAIPPLETALNGKRRLIGLDEPDLHVTWFELLGALAAVDTPTAARRLDQAVADIRDAQGDGVAEDFRRVAAFWQRWRAGRITEAAGEFEAAVHHYRATLSFADHVPPDRLPVLPPMLWEDLGDAQLGAKRLEEAEASFREAHSRLCGTEGLGRISVTTLAVARKLVDCMLKLQKSDEAAAFVSELADLLESDMDVASLDERRTMLLINMLGSCGMFDRATALERRRLALDCEARVRKAIVSVTAGDPVDLEVTGLSEAMTGTLLALRLMPVDDPRFLPLALLLGDTAVEIIGRLVSTRMDVDSAYDQFGFPEDEDTRALTKEQADARDALLRQLVPDFEAYTAEAGSLVVDIVDQVKADPSLASLLPRALSDLAEGARAPVVVHWLVGEAIEARSFDLCIQNLVLVIEALIGMLVGVDARTTFSQERTSMIWGTQGTSALPDASGVVLRALADVSVCTPEGARLLVDAASAVVCQHFGAHAGEGASRKHWLGEAERLRASVTERLDSHPITRYFPHAPNRAEADSETAG